MERFLVYYYDYYNNNIIHYKITIKQRIINFIMVFKGDSRRGNIQAQLCCWHMRTISVNGICTYNTCEYIFLSSCRSYMVVYLSDYFVVHRIKTTLIILNVHCSELLKNTGYHLWQLLEYINNGSKLNLTCVVIYLTYVTTCVRSL